ncbi:MAG TPA: carboxylesterase family protein [Trebonia sp.]|jgi:para-nitrobenzyl esterase
MTRQHSQPAGSGPVERVVETGSGRIAGLSGGGVDVFKGVPYGAGTAGRRFQAPAPAPSWTGVRDATEYGPRAPQPPRGPVASSYSPMSSWREQSPAMSEDCLVLNVWAPSGPRAGLPVMVWLHGGGFGAGSGSRTITDGTTLAADGDVVVVTLNHRLGSLGFLYLAELGGAEFRDSGQAGMLDIVLALRWVRDNVARFGGDPGNVTIFGESGGGAKVAYLMGMPAAVGLFHRAIIQSGPYLRGSSPERATALAERVLHGLGLGAGDLGRLPDIPADQLVAALGDNSKMANRVAFVPVTDGRNLPRDPFAPDATPLCRDIPLIVGNTRWEYILQFGQEDPANFDLDFQALPGRLTGVLSQGGSFAEVRIPDPSETVGFYRRVRPGFSASDIFFAALTDSRMLRNSALIAERRARLGGAATYVYVIDWNTPVDGGRWHAPHAMDVPLVFGTVDGSPSMLGTGATPRRLSGQMMRSWISFARTGVPAAGDLPGWPAYEETRRQTMLFDETSRVESDPQSDVRRYWSDGSSGEK